MFCYIIDIKANDNGKEKDIIIKGRTRQFTTVVYAVHTTALSYLRYSGGLIHSADTHTHRYDAEHTRQRAKDV